MKRSASAIHASRIVTHVFKMALTSVFLPSGIVRFANTFPNRLALQPLRSTLRCRRAKTPPVWKPLASPCMVAGNGCPGLSPHDVRP